MIRCPKCKGASLVTDTRPTRSTVRRRRECYKCKHCWSTCELPLEFADVIAEFKAEAEKLRKHITRMEAQVVKAGIRMRGKATWSSDYVPVDPSLSLRRRWTKEEYQQLDELYPLLGSDGTARRIGRSVESVKHVAKQRGLIITRAHHNRDCNHMNGA